jgi:hypothetical protein
MLKSPSENFYFFEMNNISSFIFNGVALFSDINTIELLFCFAVCTGRPYGTGKHVLIFFYQPVAPTELFNRYSSLSSSPFPSPL